MQGLIRQVRACRVCGSDAWLDVLSFGEVPLAGGFLDPGSLDGEEPRFPLDVAVCQVCWLMSLRHVVSPELLFSHYLYASPDSELIARHMRHVVELCVSRLGLMPGDLVVEFGSNTGNQLRAFRDAGMAVLGVDPAKNLAAVANGQKIETFPEFFTAELGRHVARDRGRARLVLGRQCFAHIDNVHDVLEGVTSLIDDDGGLMIEVPYLFNLLTDNQFDTIFHEHLSYYSLGTLARLFGSHGLRIIEVEQADVHGGSIVVLAVLAASRRPSHPAVRELIAYEREYQLMSEHAYRQFADRTESVRSAIRNLVRGLVAQGKQVAGYGAPAKGSALLNACGIRASEVSYCIDATRLKQGKLLPGTRIPVYSPDRANSRPPDYYLLLAWNYAGEILSRERGYLDAGGRFIIPIPEPWICSADSALTQLRGRV